MPGLNAAQRVVDHIRKASSIGHNTAVIEVLNAFFSYEPAEPYRDHARRLDMLLKQVDITVAGLERLNFPAHLYRHQVEATRNAFSAQLLNSNWNNVISQLTPDVVLAFEWAAFALAVDDGELDEKDLAELLEKIKELKADPSLKGLPPAFRDLIELHLDSILEALQLYPISGIEPLCKAVKDFAVQVAVDHDELKAHEHEIQPKARPFLTKFFDTMKKTTDAASTATKTAEQVEKIWKMVADKGPLLLEYIRDLSGS